MLKRYKYLQYGIIILVIWACQPKKKNISPKLLANLEFAGENRNQLEEVLNFYSNPKDSLKLKAAVFLIENMDGLFSYDSNILNLNNSVLNK